MQAVGTKNIKNKTTKYRHHSPDKFLKFFGSIFIQLKVIITIRMYDRYGLTASPGATQINPSAIAESTTSQKYFWVKDIKLAIFTKHIANNHYFIKSFTIQIINTAHSFVFFF